MPRSELTLEQIEALSELEKAATPGPFFVDDSRPQELTVCPRNVPWACDFPSTEVDCLPDAELFAALRNAAPSLLALAGEALHARDVLYNIASYIDMGHVHPDHSGFIWHCMQVHYDAHIRPLRGPGVVAAHTSSEGK